jgi:predicted secreted Zn-dependent protease
MSGALNSVFGGGGILGAALNVAGMLFPPLGLATSLANMVTQVVGQGVNQAAQQMCKEMGMPKFIADIVGDIVQKAVSGNTQPSDPKCDSKCGSDSGVQDFMKDFAQQLCKDLVDKCKEELEGEAKKGGGKKKGGSWLEALARAMGEVAGDKAAKMVELSNKITGLSGDDSPEAAKEMTAVTQELNGTSKMFSMLQDAFNNVVKSIGDGLATAARKQ